MTNVKLASVALVLTIATAACSGSTKHSAAGAPAKAAGGAAAGGAAVVGPDAPAPAPEPSVRGAVEALLNAEQRGDHTASFVLLSDEARATYKDIHRWSDRRDELPAITGYQVQGSGGKGVPVNSLVTVVDHRASLDPFRGLSAAQDRETWVARPEHGGWVVDADPQTQLILPPDRGAPAAAVAWAQAAEACNSSAAAARQAVDPLLGMATATQQLCGHQVTFSAGPPRSVSGTPEAQDLIAQYSSDSLGWARAVTVSGADHPFEAVLAPIGDEWQVVGVYAAT